MDGPTIRPKPQAVLTCIQSLISTRAMMNGTTAFYICTQIYNNTDFIYLQLITQEHGVQVDKSRSSKPAKNESHNKHIYRI